MVTVLDIVGENRYRLLEEVRNVVVLLVATTLVATACGARTAGGRTSVVAGFYPLAWAAQQVGGNGVDVENLTPSGAEPHDLELAPRDVAEVQRADVVLYLSHDFQPAVQRAVDGARGKRVDVLSGLALRGDDPHVWLDPALFARVVERIGAALGTPKRAARLVARLRALDREYRTGLASCERRDFVTSHAAFGYLAERYGLRQIPITGVDPESEPSPKRLRSLIDLVRRERITTVFFERLVSPRLAETIARDAGAKARVLDPIEGLTESEQRRGDDYFTLMRRNLRALRVALACR
jgi:zinc transport system substrate-binding protein